MSKFVKSVTHTYQQTHRLKIRNVFLLEQLRLYGFYCNWKKKNNYKCIFEQLKVKNEKMPDFKALISFLYSEYFFSLEWILKKIIH